jgi:REP element-mobilizing transposase RayT
MNNKLKDRKTPRLQTWDYRWAASYFITICTKNRLHYFGKIENAEMKLSNIGVIADILWYEIKNHAKNIELGEFAVMPNHIHGIIVITNFDDSDTNVGTGHALSLQSEQSEQSEKSENITGQNRFQNIGKNSISSIVGSYKSAVTKHAHRLGYQFEWQTRFYDNIIRNTESYEFITEYITNNPAKWQEDKFYSE